MVYTQGVPVIFGQYVVLFWPLNPKAIRFGAWPVL